MEQSKLRRVSRLLYYYALSTKSATVALTIPVISKVAILTKEEATDNLQRIGALMGKGCTCSVMNNKLHITFKVGAPDRARHVFEYWKQSHGKSKATKLTSGRRAKINARLREGYTAQDIKRGINGILCSKFHVDGGYTDISHVCGTGAKLERFMELGKQTKIIRKKGILGHMSKVTS